MRVCPACHLEREPEEYNQKLHGRCVGRCFACRQSRRGKGKRFFHINVWKAFRSLSAGIRARHGVEALGERTKQKRLASVGQFVPQVYFLQAGDDGPIKIGHTTRPVQDRIDKLQVGNAYELRLIGTIEAHAPYERVLHRKFKHIRMRGEWYRPEVELLQLIQALASQTDGAPQIYEISQ
jgi:hypothetical protein